MRNTFKVTLVSVLGISVLMSGCKLATSQESQQTEIQPENTGCLVCKDLEKLDALASKSNSFRTKMEVFANVSASTFLS